MVRVSDLKQLDPTAWTTLLQEDSHNLGISVTAVQAEQLPHAPALTRYFISLSGHPEPISLIGKQTNSVEADFYQEVAGRLPSLVPRCWLSHVTDDQSWILLDEVHNNHRPEAWAAEDVEFALADLATVHATFWNQGTFLENLGWQQLPGAAKGPDPLPGAGIDPLPPGKEKRDAPSKQAARLHAFRPGRSGFISNHALNAAGRLAPSFVRAADGLDRLQALGGWPGILDELQLLAMADLLDDPVPILQPLREQPVTLLHGNPASDKWHLSLLGERHLVGWQNVIVGPAIYDLASFVAQFPLLRSRAGVWSVRTEWPLSEETMVDSYLLNMGSLLGPDFQAMSARRAIPAARCLYTLLEWLPPIAGWLSRLDSERGDQLDLARMNDDAFAAAGLPELIELRPFLRQLFDNFMTAYRTL